MAAPARRSPAHLLRRHPGHCQHRHPGRPPVRARAHHRPRPGTRRAAGGNRAPPSTPRDGPQLRREGGAPRRARPGQPAPLAHRRRARPPARRARGGAPDRRGGRPPTLRHRCHGGQHRHHRHRPAGPHRRDRPRTRRVAARRRCHGRHRHGSPRAALDVGRGRAGGLGGLESPQVARHRLRLHRLPRARSRPPGAGHGHRPELPAPRRTAR